MTKQAQSSFADDVWDVEQASTTQNLVVGHEVVPADVQIYVVGIVQFLVNLMCTARPTDRLDVVTVSQVPGHSLK